MVEHPQRVETLLAGHAALLPVQPPEVDTFGLHAVVHVEIGVHEVRVGEVEFHVLLGGRVDADALGDFGVGVLERAHAVARVDVQCGAQAAPVQVGEEGRRVGEQFAIPRVAGPAGTVLRVHVVHAMPVHVDHGGGERDALALEAVHQGQIAVLRVPVVAAPPVAHGEARQERRGAGQAIEVAYGLDVAVAIAEEVQVRFGGGARGYPGAERVRLAVHRVGFDDDVGGGIVDDGPAVARDHAVVKLDGAVRLVQRAGGAFEVAALGVAVMPGVELGVGHAFDDHAQAFLAERLLVVDDGQGRGVDDDAAVTLGDAAFDRATEIAVQDGLGRAVLEYAGIGPFESHERIGDESDAPVLAGHHIVGAHGRRGVEAEVLRIGRGRRRLLELW